MTCVAQTANLLKDIRTERFYKIDMGLKALEGPITVKLNNVSAMECNMIRHFFQGALNQFYKLAQVSPSYSILHYHTSNQDPMIDYQSELCTMLGMLRVSALVLSRKALCPACCSASIPCRCQQTVCIMNGSLCSLKLLGCGQLSETDRPAVMQMEEPVDMGVLGTAATSQQTQQENRPPPRQLRRTQR